MQMMPICQSMHKQASACTATCPSQQKNLQCKHCILDEQKSREYILKNGTEPPTPSSLARTRDLISMTAQSQREHKAINKKT